jgi:hypothetical protein
MARNSSKGTPLHDDALRPGGRVESGGGEGTPALNFDDEEIYSGRAKARRSGGTWTAEGADSAPLGPPAEQLSPSNLPSDRDAADAEDSSNDGSSGLQGGKRPGD